MHIVVIFSYYFELHCSILCVIQKENAQGEKKRTGTGTEKEKGTGIGITEITIETEVRGMIGVEGELKITSGIEVMIMTGSSLPFLFGDALSRWYPTCQSKQKKIGGLSVLCMSFGM